jgi:3-hydroxybutyryl-CoA dehydratase
MTAQYRSPRSFDDLAVGDELESYGRTITDADIILFTGIAGIKLPIFLDEEYCKKHTTFGGRIVPGPLLLSFASAMIIDLIGPTTISGLGWDKVRFFVPAHPGDTIRTRIRVESKRDTSDGERGILEIAPTVIDQHGTDVMSCLNTLMMRKGPLEM